MQEIKVLDAIDFDGKIIAPVVTLDYDCDTPVATFCFLNYQKVCDEIVWVCSDGVKKELEKADFPSMFLTSLEAENILQEFLNKNEEQDENNED